MKNFSIFHKIKELAYLCKESYDLKKLSDKSKIFRNDLGLDCSLIEDKEKEILIIVFTGTNEKKDWYCNLNCKKYYFCKTEYVHNGAYQMYNESKKEIITEIKKIKFKKLIITGHSLGGYLAQIMAYDLLINYGMYSSIFIFGSALIISKEIQKIFWKNNIIIFEIYLQKDIVPKLLKWLYPSYYSIKIKIRSERKNCFNIINNHLMKAYIEALEYILHKNV